jgi:hypothetical protein
MLNASSGDSLTKAQLTDIGHGLCEYFGIDMSSRRIKWIAQRFCALCSHWHAHSRERFFQFFASEVGLTVEQRRKALADPEICRVLQYNDITGETAVNNILHGRNDDSTRTSKFRAESR